MSKYVKYSTKYRKLDFSAVIALFLVDCSVRGSQIPSALLGATSTRIDPEACPATEGSVEGP